VRELLELLAATKPLVLILDDLHWADSGSIELIGALCAAAVGACATRDGGPATAEPGAAGRGVRTCPPCGTAHAARASAFSLRRRASPEAASMRPRSRGERRQSLLPRAARALARARGCALAASTSVGGVEVPPAVAAALAEEPRFRETPDARRELAVAGGPVRA
jgi:hypothetical protein